jgi:hypothetical protein
MPSVVSMDLTREVVFDLGVQLVYSANAYHEYHLVSALWSPPDESRAVAAAHAAFSQPLRLAEDRHMTVEWRDAGFVNVRVETSFGPATRLLVLHGQADQVRPVLARELVDGWRLTDARHKAALQTQLRALRPRHEVSCHRRPSQKLLFSFDEQGRARPDRWLARG